MIKELAFLMMFLAGCSFGALALHLANLLIAKKYLPTESARRDMIFDAADDGFSVKSGGAFTSWLGRVLRAFCDSLAENWFFAVIVMAFLGAGWALSAVIFGFGLLTAQILVTLSIALVIAIIDIKVQRIPNILILLLLGFTLLFWILGIRDQSLSLHFLGFAVTVLLFCLPLLLTKAVESGDIKYLAVMGFCLGYPDGVQAIMIFSGILLVWVAALLISKKGSLKTRFALGPFISLGLAAAMLI